MADNKLWAFLAAVSEKRDTSIIDDPDFEKDYNPFIVNRALSYHEDAVLAANLLNERHGLSKADQVRFLVGTIRPRKRYAKWYKSEMPENVTLVAEYYGCSTKVARGLVALHTPEQIEVLKARTFKGGSSRK